MSEEVIDNTNLGTAPLQDRPLTGGVLATGILSILLCGLSVIVWIVNAVR